MSKKKILKFEREPLTGRLLVSGLFKFADTHGFSLADSLVLLRKRGINPNLREYIDAARAAGWPDDRIQKKIAAALTDSGWPVRERAILLKRCQDYMNPGGVARDLTRYLRIITKPS